MTLLYLFYLENKQNIYNLLEEYKGFIFDHNINSSENKLNNQFKTKYDIKYIKFIKGEPHFQDKYGKLFSVSAIHCQGTSKILIPLLYKGIDFKENKKPIYINCSVSFLKHKIIYSIKKILRPLKRFLYRLLKK